MLDGEGLHLAIWMRERYFCTVYYAARAMLPAGDWNFSLQDRYRLAPGIGRERAYEGGRKLGICLYHRGDGVCLRQRRRSGKIRTVFGTRNPGPRSSSWWTVGSWR